MPTKEEGVGRSDVLKIDPSVFDQLDLSLQLRTELDPEWVEELAHRIGKQGQLQAGVVRRNSSGKIQVTAGFTRLASITKVNTDPAKYGADGPMSFLAKLIVMTEEEAYAANLAENLDRKNLSPADLSNAATKLKRSDWTTEAIADALRCKPPKVALYLMIASLPRKTRVALHRGEINEAGARALGALKAEKVEIEELTGDLAAHKITASDLTARVKQRKRAAGKPQARTLKEVKTALEAIDTAPAQDFLSWVSGELGDEVLETIFAERT